MSKKYFRPIIMLFLYSHFVADQPYNSNNAPSMRRTILFENCWIQNKISTQRHKEKTKRRMCNGRDLTFLKFEYNGNYELMYCMPKVCNFVRHGGTCTYKQNDETETNSYRQLNNNIMYLQAHTIIIRLIKMRQ